MTTTLILATALFGAFLGLRFGVFVLIPATVLIWLAIFMIGTVAGESARQIVCAAFLSTISLQVGYVSQAIRSVADRNRGTRHSSNIASLL